MRAGDLPLYLCPDINLLQGRDMDEMKLHVKAIFDVAAKKKLLPMRPPDGGAGLDGHNWCDRHAQDVELSRFRSKFRVRG